MAAGQRVTVWSGTSAPAAVQAAFLVDADNFSDVLALESAWAQLQARAGRVGVCRAYGAPARLQSLAGVWRSLGARTFPNLALEKNTTDAALIADAVALHFQQGVRLFAIASGDADFAPLAVRLREWGCEVWCFSMENILFAGAQAYYDRVVRYTPSPAVVTEPLAPTVAVKKTPLSVAGAPQALEPSAAVIAAAAPGTTAASAPAAPAMPFLPVVVKVVLSEPTSVGIPKNAKPAPVLPDMVQRILKALPQLRVAPQLLSQAIPVLRQKTILGKTTKSTAFFAHHAEYFKLSPAHQPTHLTYAPPLCVAKALQELRVQKSAQIVTSPVAMPAPKPASMPAVLAWPTGRARKPAPPLLAELHGLRTLLVQLALRGVTVADVLLAVPELLHGQPCALSAVAGRLREKGLLNASQSALRILERYPDAFRVEMDRAPQAVIYRQ